MPEAIVLRLARVRFRLLPRAVEWDVGTCISLLLSMQHTLQDRVVVFVLNHRADNLQCRALMEGDCKS